MRTVLLPRIDVLMFVATHNTSFVASGMAFVAVMMMLVSWLVMSTVSEKMVSSAR